MSNYNYNTLCHHGIKGQKWGIRRYQNEDGSLTAEGRKRYEVSGGSMSKEGTKLYKSDLREYKKDRQIAMQDSVKDLRKNSSGVRKLAGDVLVGLRGTQERGVYDAARASGSGKFKSYMRSVFDIGWGGAVRSGVNMVGSYAQLKLGTKVPPIAVKAATRVVAEIGDISVTQALHAKGKATSLQEKSLRKRDYNTDDK